LHDDIWSLALGFKVVKFSVSDVKVHEVPPKLSLAYMITAHLAGNLTGGAHLLGAPLAPSCEVVQVPFARAGNNLMPLGFMVSSF
jgi:hypothetical protein